ncbi:MAG: ABC transporter ATP-binding protein [Pedobacter sp.]|nr:ABC transporter ATP-binding protein [Pedobacter sp.]
MSQRYPLLRTLALYRYMPWRFALTATLFAVVNLSLAWQQWLLGRAIHDVERGAAVVKLPDGALDFHLAWYWLAVLAAVAFGRGLLQYIAGILSLIIGQELLFILRERILVQVQRLDLAYHGQHGMGEMVTRTTRDADKLRDALINFWRQVFETALVITAAVAMLCWYNIWLGLVPLVLTLTGIGIFVAFTDRLVALDRAVGSAYDTVSQELSEGVHGVRVIKAFGLEPARIAAFNAQVDVFAAHAREAIRYAATHIPLPQVVVALGHVWVLLFGAHLVASGALNIGELVAALLMVTTLVFRAEGIGRVMQVFADARSSAARIWEVLDAEPAIKSGQDVLPAGPLGLEFAHVSVPAPGGGRDILRDCSFTVAPGEMVAVVGTTGSGKSTLLALLPRLADVESGHIRLGSVANGWQDLRSTDLADLRRQVHVVSQESFLFSDTLAANLRFAAPHASDDELHRALEFAAADDVLERLEEGFATKLGDRGVTLSGGQRQRLCLARAILAGARIIAFDDATSALDAATEKRILDNIRRSRRDGAAAATVIIVSSKLSTILMADRVLLLADGRIADAGSHAELAARNAAYRDLMGIAHGE